MSLAYRCDDCGMLKTGKPDYTLTRAPEHDLEGETWDLCKTCGEKHVKQLTGELMISYEHKYELQR